VTHLFSYSAVYGSLGRDLSVIACQRANAFSYPRLHVRDSSRARNERKFSIWVTMVATEEPLTS